MLQTYLNKPSQHARASARQSGATSRSHSLSPTKTTGRSPNKPTGMVLPSSGPSSSLTDPVSSPPQPGDITTGPPSSLSSEHSTLKGFPNAGPSQSRPEDDVDMADGGEGEDDEGSEDVEEQEEVEEVSGSEGEEDEEEEDEDDDGEDSEADSEDEEGSDIELIDARGPDGGELAIPVTVKVESGPDGAAVNTEGAVEAGASGEVTNELVPKKKRPRRRSPSEEEDLPPPPPPMKTIRLERTMLEPGSTLEWNILEDARERGMVEVWAAPDEEREERPKPQTVVPDGSGPSSAIPLDAPVVPGLDFDDLREAEEIARQLEEKYGDQNKPKKRRKPAKVKKAEEYDVEDPFIDDSELLVDAPTHFGRPKKEGFYVHSGPLELMEESPVKAKSRTAVRKAPKPVAGPSGPRRSLAQATNERLYGQVSSQDGTRSSPIAIDDDDDRPGSSGARGGAGTPSPPEPPTVIDRALFKNAARDPRLLPPFPTFPTEVRNKLRALREESMKHPWNPNTKSKFPEHLRAPLQTVGEAAYRCDMFNETLFSALPSVLPYNSFTLTKLMTKLCHEGYWQFLLDCEHTGITQLKDLVEEEKEQWTTKYEDSRAAWLAATKEWDEKHANGSNGEPASTLPPITDPGHPNGDDDQPSQPGERPKEPPKRFSWTPEMRFVLEQLLENMQDMVDLNKRLSDYGFGIDRMKGKEYTENNMRSRLYKRIVDCFPDGYATGTTVSREASKVKKVKEPKGQLAE